MKGKLETCPMCGSAVTKEQLQLPPDEAATPGQATEMQKPAKPAKPMPAKAAPMPPEEPMAESAEMPEAKYGPEIEEMNAERQRLGKRPYRNTKGIAKVMSLMEGRNA